VREKQHYLLSNIEVVMALSIKIPVFWDVALCNLVDITNVPHAVTSEYIGGGFILCFSDLLTIKLQESSC
jgi:hypothetical protein